SMAGKHVCVEDDGEGDAVDAALEMFGLDPEAWVRAVGFDGAQAPATPATMTETRIATARAQDLRRLGTTQITVRSAACAWPFDRAASRRRARSRADPSGIPRQSRAVQRA